MSRHPEIGAGGEQPFWLRRATAHGTLEATYLSPEAGGRLAREYLSLLRRIAPSAARVTDKLPFNLPHVGIIHLLLPQARIIQCRRHPVDTCLSIYFTHFQQTISFASDKGALAAAWRQYARLMDHWRAVLPTDRLFEVDYEKLVADRERVTRQLVDFAGLGWDDACLSPERNPRPLTTDSLWQARQPVYASSVARWRQLRAVARRIARTPRPRRRWSRHRVRLSSRKNGSLPQLRLISPEIVGSMAKERTPRSFLCRNILRGPSVGVLYKIGETVCGVFS